MRKTGIALDRGAMVVNDATVIAEGPYVAAISVDMATKRGNVGGYWGDSRERGPGLEVYASDESLYLNEEVPRDQRTVIYFPEFKGWNIWSAEICKYTVAVCLVKDGWVNADERPSEWTSKP